MKMTSKKTIGFFGNKKIRSTVSSSYSGAGCASSLINRQVGGWVAGLR